MLAIGLDVGGTTVKSALLKVVKASDPKSYRILKTAVVRTDTSGGKETILLSIEAAAQAVEDRRVEAAGVGSAGDVDPDTGIVAYATDSLPGFTGLDLYCELNARLSTPTIIINDASAATIGEVFFGAGRGSDRVLMLTLGTGLGCSLYVRKKSGALDSESVVNYRLGHYELHPDGRLCLCGLKGCAEQYVSATAIKKNAVEAGFEPRISTLFHAFQQKDPRAEEAVMRFFRDFTDVLLYAVREYAPALIVVGGGVTEASGWWEAFEAYAKKEISVPLKRAELKNKAGFLGAVYNALNGNYQKQKGASKQ